MTPRDNKIIRMLTSEAEEADYRAGGARIAAAVVIRNDVISLGRNMRKTSPFQKMFGRNEEAIFYHAETMAIRKAIKNLGLEQATLDEIHRAFRRATLYVVRIKAIDADHPRRMIYGLARPCCGCMEAMKKFGIGRVIYSKNENETDATVDELFTEEFMEFDA
jgi:tRNA(Arg) A34 adenosine deaminase TadA